MGEQGIGGQRDYSQDRAHPNKSIISFFPSVLNGFFYAIDDFCTSSVQKHPGLAISVLGCWGG